MLKIVPEPLLTQFSEAGLTDEIPVFVAVIDTVPTALQVARPALVIVANKVLELPQFVQL